MLIGSSGLPSPAISCISVFPMDVTRSETRIVLPSNVPSQVPAKVFSFSNDFCASVCAKAMVHSDSRTSDSIKRRDFMVHSPKDFFSLFPGPLARIADASFRPLQVKVCVDGLVPWFHISPILDVMVRVDRGEHRMMHVSVLRATGDVMKLEFHALAVR